MKKKDKVLLATVHRSFTHSVFAMLKEEYDDVTRLHIWPKGIIEAKTGDYIVMITYRDPYDVANSWIKRSPHWRSGLWRAQWEALSELYLIAERVYRLKDLDRHLGSFGQYEKHYPTRIHGRINDDIKYAEDLCKEHGYYVK